MLTSFCCCRFLVLSLLKLRLLLQDHVYNACTNHSIDREAWILKLMDTGHEAFSESPSWRRWTRTTKITKITLFCRFGSHFVDNFWHFGHFLKEVWPFPKVLAAKACGFAGGHFTSDEWRLDGSQRYEWASLGDWGYERWWETRMKQGS